MSGFLGDVTYEATHALSGSSTDLQLGYSLPSGVQLTADVRADGNQVGIDKVSAFHVAGPFNVEPAWLRASRTMRLTLGRGGWKHRCPFSLRTDMHEDGSKDYELAYKHDFDESRKLRARLSLPGETAARALWAEYRDSTIENGRSVWIAQASVPLDEQAVSMDGGLSNGLLRKAHFSLRRAWTW